MREPAMRLIITFHTTTEAMAAEQFCKEQALPGRLIPVPRAITAGCGLAWMAPEAEEKRLRPAMEQAGMAWDGWYRMML